jgi:hypothetical protein
MPCSEIIYYIVVTFVRMCSLFILWHICPMREMLKEPQGTRLCNSSGVLPRHALPPLPSPRFTPHRALLGYAVNTGLCNSKEGSRDLHDVTRNSTQRCILQHL